MGRFPLLTNRIKALLYNNDEFITRNCWLVWDDIVNHQHNIQ